MAKEKNGSKNGKPHKIPQPHGGALNSGGTPGNKGGTGRPPNVIREMAREGMTKALPNILRIATASTSGQAVRDGDAVAAFAALARVGLPSQMEVGENPEAPLLTEQERLARMKALLK